MAYFSFSYSELPRSKTHNTRQESSPRSFRSPFGNMPLVSSAPFLIRNSLYWLSGWVSHVSGRVCAGLRSLASKMKHPDT